jgi:hypothetical protein
VEDRVVRIGAAQLDDLGRDVDAARGGDDLVARFRPSDFMLLRAASTGSRPNSVSE